MDKKEIKLSPLRQAILEFMMNCPSGITTLECQKMFGTTELRRALTDIRRAGNNITYIWEQTPQRINGYKPKPHKRYFYNES